MYVPFIPAHRAQPLLTDRSLLPAPMNTYQAPLLFMAGMKSTRQSRSLLCVSSLIVPSSQLLNFVCQLSPPDCPPPTTPTANHPPTHPPDPHWSSERELNRRENVSFFSFNGGTSPPLQFIITCHIVTDDSAWSRASFTIMGHCCLWIRVTEVCFFTSTADVAFNASSIICQCQELRQEAFAALVHDPQRKVWNSYVQPVFVWLHLQKATAEIQNRSWVSIPPRIVKSLKLVMETTRHLKLLNISKRFWCSLEVIFFQKCWDRSIITEVSLRHLFSVFYLHISGGAIRGHMAISLQGKMLRYAWREYFIASQNFLITFLDSKTINIILCSQYH